jgi:cytochrome oxidase assembly protein ShyY1
MVTVFIWSGFWQLSRLNERQATNEIVTSRSDAPAKTMAQALADGDTSNRSYVPILDTGRWLEPEFVRVANRSQNGRAGDWLVGTFVTDDDVVVLINRGFLGRDDTPEPATDGEITGWLQESRKKDGYFGAADTNAGERVPRLNVPLLGERAGLDVAPLWLQQSAETEAFAILQPVPLPPIDEGSHFSYAMQWFTFATLTSGFYLLILRKKAREKAIESATRSG